MREQIDTATKTEQTADNRPLTDAELNEVSGGDDHGSYGNVIWQSGAGLPSWGGYTQNITEAQWWGPLSGTFLPFAWM
jgi:hypothetical protein